MTPLVEEMVMDLLYWEFPHIQRPEHRDTSDTKGIISDPSLNTSGTNLQSAKVETSDNKTSRTEPSLNSSASAEENPNTGTNLYYLNALTSLQVPSLHKAELRPRLDLSKPKLNSDQG